MKRERALELIAECEKKSESLFNKAHQNALYNQSKILDAFRDNRVTYTHFSPSNGYGYGDLARETLNKLYADVLCAEDCIVSPLIANGTHAISLALFGVLRPRDTMLSITGKPYDTLDEVISGQGNGSLKDFGIIYRQIELTENGGFDKENIKTALAFAPKLVYIQRSKGYSWRESFSVYEIGEIIKVIKSLSPQSIIMVDNCYGEFVEDKEPTDFGADLIAGSLIKNIGGGIAPTGGYIAGRRDCIEQVSYRLTAPSLGSEVGSYFASYQPFYQGLFMAPSIVKNAVMGEILSGFAFDAIGYDTMPKAGVLPKDIIRSIRFNTAQEQISFCQSIQKSSPIEGYVTPEPWEMPGYSHKVIMAAGTFVQGASLELTADGTVHPPYIAYLQGGLTYEHYKLALLEILQLLNP